MTREANDEARQQKLDELQEKHRELTRLKNAKKRAMSTITTELGEINKELRRLGGQIYDLKNINGDTPHITDHAVVRYLERVKDMNIWDIKAEIMQHRDAVRIDNTIVTVNGGDKDDPSMVEEKP